MTTRRTKRAVAGVAALTLLLGAIVGVALVSDDEHTAVAAADDLAGVHVIHQVPQAAGGTLTQARNELTNATAGIRNALAVPGVVAFGVRVPWNIIERPDGTFDPTILDQARAVVNTPGDSLTVRFMAGRHTPSRYLTGPLACPTITSGSGTSAKLAPAPFTSTGAPNTCILTAYDRMVDWLDGWARANGVHEVHLSHYALDWAEFYWGPEVQAIAGSGATGQTYMVNATNALVDIGLAHADAQVAYELPMSGHGPLMRSCTTCSPGIAERVADHVVAAAGAESDRFYIQGNGWDQDGIWGAATQATESLMDHVIDDPRPLLGVQMIQPQAYIWSQVFAEATRHEATYGEVYLPSFTAAGSSTVSGDEPAALRAAIAAWVPYRPATPPPPTTTTTTAPTTTTTFPPTTTTTLPPTTTTTLPPTTTTTTVPTATCEARWNGVTVESRETTLDGCRLAA